MLVEALAEGGFPARTESEVRSALGNGYHYLMEHCAPAGTEEHIYSVRIESEVEPLLDVRRKQPLSLIREQVLYVVSVLYPAYK